MTSHDQTTRIALAAALALTFTLAGCGADDKASTIGVGARTSGLTDANGLAKNGLAKNGLAKNGLAKNGLAKNGLAKNGLLSLEFQSWFEADPATSASVMTYVVRCAAPGGQIYSFTSPATGLTYEWTGSLGLAPGWASGLEATEAEEQVITACLAAHVNKYGVHVEMSVLGKGATGESIPVGENELATFSQREACFFGNLFADEGVFAGIDHPLWNAAYSSARACAFDIFGIGQSADCPPVNNVGPCGLICTASPDGSSYSSCGTFVNGAWKTYLPITTRILPADVYTCGDGTCQFTEQCGTKTTANSCRADCGACAVTPTFGTTTTTENTTTATATTTATTTKTTKTTGKTRK